MITEALIGIFAGIATLVGTLLPDFDPPEWLTVTLPNAVGAIAPYLAGANTWLPLDHMGTVLSFVAFVLATALAVKLARIVASFATFGGGSAA